MGKSSILLSAAVAGLLMVSIQSFASGETSGKAQAASSCKDKSACKGESNACKGQNSCKEKEWVKLSKKACEQKGGTYKESAEM
jgi:hypothetical protein